MKDLNIATALRTLRKTGALIALVVTQVLRFATCSVLLSDHDILLALLGSSSIAFLACVVSVDCLVSAWSNYTACSVACGGGANPCTC